MINKIIGKGKKLFAEYIFAGLLFAAVLIFYQVMHSQQNEEVVKALQTIERIKLKWAFIEE